MAEPRTSTCTPWATVDDLCDPCLSNYDTIPSDLLDHQLQVASDLLFMLSGKQFPGLCEMTVRPCAQKSYYDAWAYRSSGYWGYPSFGCGCSVGRCGCPKPSQITLGVQPIVSIKEVKVDGDVLDSSLYRIDDFRYLVRLRDPDGSYATWPCCQDILLPDTEPDTFSVTFIYGRTPPLAGIHAAAILACEFALACSPVDGVECRLPKRVQSLSRQGVNMVLLDPMEFLAAGKLGIHEVDSFISAWNPHGLKRASGVYNVDRIPSVRRVGT